MPLAIDALAQMGLGGLLADLPGRAVASWRIVVDGEEVFRIPEPVAELGDRAVRVVSPAALLGRVLDEVAARRATAVGHRERLRRVTGPPPCRPRSGTQASWL